MNRKNENTIRELTTQELNELKPAGGSCTGFVYYVFFKQICCGPTLPGNYTSCANF